MAAEGQASVSAPPPPKEAQIKANKKNIVSEAGQVAGSKVRRTSFRCGKSESVGRGGLCVSNFTINL